MNRRARTRTHSRRWCARRATRRGFGPKRLRSQSPCSHALPCSLPRTPPQSSRLACSESVRRGRRTTTTRCMNSNRSRDVCRPRQSQLKIGDPTQGRLVARAAMEVAEVAEVAGWAALASWAAREAQEVVREAREAKGALGLGAAAWVGAAAMVETTVVWELQEALEALASHRISLPHTIQTKCSCWRSIRGPSTWRLASRRHTSP
jgi:hypothetical protein